MQKYLSIFKISLQGEIAYKMNFIMWRVRNVIQILIIYFLWSNIFFDSQVSILGYNRSSILTYVFGIILIRAFVFSARSVDVPTEISMGDLSNYLLKPVKYFYYWFTRDLASKILNFSFSIGEFLILFLIFQPELFIQQNMVYIILFLISIINANYLLFIIRFLVTSITFKIPEMAWGGQFLFMVIITEFLSGAVFPLDIFPAIWQKIFYLTPFPYLIFFPLQIYLAKLTLVTATSGVLISILWSFILTILLKTLWAKGLKLYSSEGR